MGKDFGGSSPSGNTRQWLCAALGERCGTEWMPSAALQCPSANAYQSVPLCDTTKKLLPCLRKGPSFLVIGKKAMAGKEGKGNVASKTHWYLVCTCSPFLCLFFMALLYNILLLLKKPTCFTESVFSAEVSLESQGSERCPVRVSVSGQNLSQCSVSIIFLMPGQGHKIINFGDMNCSCEFQHFRGFAFASIQARYCIRALVACNETWH